MSSETASLKVNSGPPLMPVIYELSEPFLRPLRRIVPMVANVDLTPLVLFIVCQLVLMVPFLAAALTMTLLLRPETAAWVRR